MNLISIQASNKNLGEQAYEIIRDWIISFQLEPGQLVSEYELGTLLGVSRSPVRDAFRRLMTEELIEVLPQRGVRIALISQQKVEETRFIRESLETSAFRQAAKSWNVANKTCQISSKRIQSTLEEQVQALSESDAKRFLQLDEEFHRLILEQAGNQTLITVVSNMRGHLNRVRYLTLREMDKMSELTNEHAQLFEAIIANDLESTIHLLENHLRKLTNELPDIISKFPKYFNA